MNMSILICVRRDQLFCHHYEFMLIYLNKSFENLLHAGSSIWPFSCVADLGNTVS